MVKNIKNNKLTPQKYISFILYGILFWLLLGYILLPICNTFVQAFKSENGYSLNVIKDYLSNPNNLIVIKNTFILGLGSIVVCAIMGIALALYMTFICMKASLM